MPHGIKCQCCKEMDTVHEQLMEQEETICIISHAQFSVVLLKVSQCIQHWWWWTEKGKNPCGYLCQTGTYINKGKREFNPQVYYRWQNIQNGCIQAVHSLDIQYSRVGRGIRKVIFLVLLLLYVMSFQKLKVCMLDLSWLSCSLHLHYFYHKNLFTWIVIMYSI